MSFRALELKEEEIKSDENLEQKEKEIEELKMGMHEIFIKMRISLFHLQTFQPCNWKSQEMQNI